MALNITYYRITIGALNSGHVDNKTVEEYMTDGSTPTDLTSSLAKEKANLRFKKILETVSEKVSPIYISDVVRGSNSVNTNLTQFDFTLVYDRPEYLQTLSVSGEPETIGTSLTGIHAIKRWVERALTTSAVENRLVYDPTLVDNIPKGFVFSSVTAEPASVSVPVNAVVVYNVADGPPQANMPDPSVVYFDNVGGPVPAIDPAAALYDATANTTWVGYEIYADGLRKPVVKGYNHTTNKWTPRFVIATNGRQDDYHGVPHMSQDQNGYLTCCYGSHAAAQVWSVTPDARDSRYYAPQTAFGTKVSYPHICTVGGVQYCVNRYGDNADGKYIGSIITSTSVTNGVPTWGAARMTFDNGASTRYYDDMPNVVGTELHVTFCISDLPDFIRQHIYYYIYDTANDTIYNYDKSFSVPSASWPISAATMNANFRLRTMAANINTSIPRLYINPNTGDRWIAFSEGSTVLDNYVPKYAYLAGGTGSWTFADLSTDILPGRYSTVTVTGSGDGGVDFYWICDPNQTSTYGGDIKKRHRNTNGTWVNQTTVIAYTDKVFGSPIKVRGPTHPNARVIFFERNADPDSLVGAGSNRIFLYGDNGFIDLTGQTHTFANTEASTFYARRAEQTLPYDERWYLDNLYTVLKEIGINKFDTFYDMSTLSTNGNDTLLNLISTNWTLTKQGTVTWTSGKGWTGDGSSGTFTAGFTPSTAGGVFANTSGHLGIVACIEQQEAKTTLGGGTAFLVVRDSTNNMSGRINQAASNGYSTSGAKGHAVISRTASNVMNFYRNASTLGTSSNAANGLSATDIKILGSTFSAQRVGFAHWGSGLTQAEVIKLYQKAVRPMMFYRGIN